MVHTNTRTTQAVLAALGAGGIVAAGVCGLTSLALADSPGSSATGVEATGTDHVTANSGSLSAGSVQASGISTQTRAGYARASVTSLTVGGQAIGSVTATCQQGITTVSHTGGSYKTSAFFHVEVGTSGGPSATAVVVTITDAHGHPAETVKAATVSCGKAPVTPPTGKPTGAIHPSGGPETSPTHTRAPGTLGDQPAPPAQPRPGHHPVTG